MYVQKDTLLVVDVFINFQNMCLGIYGFDHAHFLSVPGLAWQAAFKKTIAKLDILTAIDLLLMVETGIKDGIWKLFINKQNLLV